MKAGLVTLPVKMMACGLESCVRVCVIRIHWLVCMTKNISTKSNQAERSLLIRAVQVRHKSIDVIVLCFSHSVLATCWLESSSSLNHPEGPPSYSRGEVGWQLGLCLILALASWVSGRGGQLGLRPSQGPQGSPG